MYSEADVQHLVAREVMRHRMGDLEAKLATHEKSVESMLTRMQGQLEEIQRSMATRSQEWQSIQTHILDKVKDDYASKVALLTLEAKVDKMWAKISIAVAAAVMVVEYSIKLFF